jgi:hypothetical protein
MTAKRLPRPRDPVQLSKLIGDILTGQIEDRAPDRPADPTKDQAAVAEMVKDGTYQVKVPLVGHALPHVLPHEFQSQEAAERWIESPDGRALIKQVRDKYVPQKSK